MITNVLPRFFNETPCILLLLNSAQLEVLSQSQVDAAAATSADVGERMSKSLSALDICCHGTLFMFTHPLLSIDWVSL